MERNMDTPSPPPASRPPHPAPRPLLLLFLMQVVENLSLGRPVLYIACCAFLKAQLPFCARTTIRYATLYPLCAQPAPLLTSSHNMNRACDVREPRMQERVVDADAAVHVDGREPIHVVRARAADARRWPASADRRWPRTAAVHL